MKKVFVFLCAVFLMATTAQADCSKGVTVIGKNNVTYCRSKLKMNWFTAFSWCESQGMTFATLEDVCPGVQVQVGSNCTNLAGSNSSSDWVWTATPFDTSFAFAVDLSSGLITNYADSSRRLYNTYVLCK